MRPRYREHGIAGAIRSAIRILADLFNAYRVMPNMVELADRSVWVKISDGYDTPVLRLRLPEENGFLEDAEMREGRQETALELMDPDVYGYMLFLLKREEDGNAEIAFRAQTGSRWVEAFTCGFARVVEGIPGSQINR